MSTPITYHGVPYDVPEARDERFAATLNPLICGFARDLNALVTLIGSAPQLVLAGTTSTLAAGATLTPATPRHQVQGNGGPVTLSAVTAIAAGVTDGQVLVLVGNHAANTVTVLDGAGTSLNGDCVLDLNTVLVLIWNATQAVWVEVARSK